MLPSSSIHFSFLTPRSQKAIVRPEPVSRCQERGCEFRQTARRQLEGPIGLAPYPSTPDNFPESCARARVSLLCYPEPCLITNSNLRQARLGVVVHQSLIRPPSRCGLPGGQDVLWRSRKEATLAGDYHPGGTWGFCDKSYTTRPSSLRLLESRFYSPIPSVATFGRSPGYKTFTTFSAGCSSTDRSRLGGANSTTDLSASSFDRADILRLDAELPKYGAFIV